MGNGIALWHVGVSKDDGLVRVDLDQAPKTLDEASSRLPGGAYTTFRTFGRGRVMRLVDHFDRLEETARLAGHPLQLNRERMAHFLGLALTHFNSENARVRMTLDLEQNPGSLYLLIEELHMPSAVDYEHGVRVVTRSLHRNNPKAKLTGFIETATQVRQALPVGLNEALMVGADGRVLEGLNSNFFGIKHAVVKTAEEGVLSGITRALVLEAIREQGIELQLAGIPVEELSGLDEAFLTSASRAVLPVTEIDGRQVGEGRPGPITRRLMTAYACKVESRLETVR